MKGLHPASAENQSAATGGQHTGQRPSPLDARWPAAAHFSSEPFFVGADQPGQSTLAQATAQNQPITLRD
jgi:hypothetical protein